MRLQESGPLQCPALSESEAGFAPAVNRFVFQPRNLLPELKEARGEQPLLCPQRSCSSSPAVESAPTTGNTSFVMHCPTLRIGLQALSSALSRLPHTTDPGYTGNSNQPERASAGRSATPRRRHEGPQSDYVILDRFGLRTALSVSQLREEEAQVLSAFLQLLCSSSRVLG